MDGISNLLVKFGKNFMVANHWRRRLDAAYNMGSV